MSTKTDSANNEALPVAVIGAGPIGLAAAAHLAERGVPFALIEKGDGPGTSVLDWGHVRMFSPWKYNVDEVSARLLSAIGWEWPDSEAFPTGKDLHDDFLAPLAAVPRIAAHTRYGTEVAAVSRRGRDRQSSHGRDRAPFVLRLRSADGLEEDLVARAVIDASGTWTRPKPLGANGLPAIGEIAARERIAYRIPDIAGRDLERYVNRSVAVVGGGASAFNALADLVAVAFEHPDTRVHWVIRGEVPGYGGGAADQFPARGKLGTRVERLVEKGQVAVHAGFGITRVDAEEDGVFLSNGEERIGPFDEIVCLTGFRPDHGLSRELRLDLDPVTEAPLELGPLIDPNLHSCGTVPPHGFDELAHPERGFYTVGMKSYGRAPTFLLMTGYEQVRSVVAALAGDLSSARDVLLELPETGVCTTSPLPGFAVEAEAVAEAAASCGDC